MVKQLFRLQGCNNIRKGTSLILLLNTINVRIWYNVSTKLYKTSSNKLIITATMPVESASRNKNIGKIASKSWIRIDHVVLEVRSKLGKIDTQNLIYMHFWTTNYIRFTVVTFELWSW